MEDVFVLSAVRTPIGKYGGGLASVPPCDLAAKVVREAVSRAGVSADDVGHVMFGNVIHTEVRDMYISRVAALNGESRELTDMLAAADAALYHAKETGRNKTHVVSASAPIA